MMRFFMSFFFLMVVCLFGGCKSAEKTISTFETVTRITERMVPVFTPSTGVNFYTKITTDRHGFPMLSDPEIQTNKPGVKIKLSVDEKGNVKGEVYIPPDTIPVAVRDTSTTVNNNVTVTKELKPSFWQTIRLQLGGIAAVVIAVIVIFGLIKRKFL